MVERVTMSGRNVIEFARYQQDRAAGKAQSTSVLTCRHCGAALLDGENEDECSSAFNIEASRLRGATRKFYAE
jgi:hypothetical protein